MPNRLLIEYLPEYLRYVREFKQTMSAEQPEFVLLSTALERFLDNQFITTATEYGVARWEKILGITPKGDATLDARKFTILARINEQLPFTMRVLERMLAQLCGADGFWVELDANAYKLTVKVALEAENNFADVGLLLKRIVPANLVVDLLLLFNTHMYVGQFTHEDLRRFTHEQIRRDDLTRLQRNTHEYVGLLTHQGLSEFPHEQIRYEPLI